MKEIKIGIVGFDTSHVSAFTRLLNDTGDPFHVSGGKVTAGFPSFSPDIESSASRVEGYKKELSEERGVSLVDSIEELVEKVDAVLLESNDGRRHLKESRPVIRAGKPCFIDKPLAADYWEAKKILDLATEYGCPIFSSSALRFDDNISRVKQDPAMSIVHGCDAFGAAFLEPSNPGLFWYGIHGVEILYTFMGTGCEALFCEKRAGTHFVAGTWKDGRIGTVRGVRTGGHSFGAAVFGEKKVVQVVYSPEIPMYAQLLKAAVSFFKTGKSPVAGEETLEIMRFMQAALLSEKEGRRVALSEINGSR